MGQKPDLSLRQIAEVAIDYETSGDSMRDVADRNKVSAMSVHRAVRAEREAMRKVDTRRSFDLQRHVADVMIEQSELHEELIDIVRERVRDTEFRGKQSGRDWAALLQVVNKEDRAWLDFFRRTFGERSSDAPDTPLELDTPDQYET